MLNQQTTNEKSAHELVKLKQDSFSKDSLFYSLNDIFYKSRYFVIPNYQRGYAWETDMKNIKLKHVNALWKDIQILCLSSNSERKHYMDVLSLSKTDRTTKELLGLKGKDCFDVIDGQQRLTTLMIMLSVLKNYFPEIEQKYLIDNEEKCRLVYDSNSTNKDFLTNNIYQDGAMSPTNIYQRNLQEAKDFIKSEVEKLDDNARKNILKCITGKLEFTLYFKPSSSDARKVFETKNNRGKKLSGLELLKNKLILLASGLPNSVSLTKEIDVAWGKIYDNLGCSPNARLVDDELLTAHWMIYGKANFNDVKKRDYNVISDILDGYFSENTTDENGDLIPFTEKEISDYVASLQICSMLWKAVKCPYSANVGVGLTDEEKVILHRLSRIGTYHHMEALLLATLYCHNKNNSLSYNVRIDLYKTIEKFIFIMRAANKSNDLWFVLKDYASKIYSETDKTKNDKTINDLILHLKYDHKNAITKMLPCAMQYMKDVSKNNFYNDFALCSYFLFEFTRKLVNEDTYPIAIDWDSFILNSVEHILPQAFAMKGKKVCESWTLVMENHLPQQKEIKNSIGNLVAVTTTGRNAGLSNYSYAVKRDLDIEGKPSYSTSTNPSERTLAANYPYWTINSIYKRSEDLLNWMYDEWFQTFTSDKLFLENYRKLFNEDFTKFEPKDFIAFSPVIDENDLKKKLDEIYPRELAEKQNAEEEKKLNQLFKIKDLIAHGLLSPGDKLYNTYHPTNSEATLHSAKYVFYNNEKMTLNEWGTKVTNWKGINIYFYTAKVGETETLHQKRMSILHSTPSSN